MLSFFKRFKKNAHQKRNITQVSNIQQAPLSYKVGNLQGQGARNYQEDSFGIVNALDVILAKKRGLFFVLADGMGGMSDGKAISSKAVKLIVEGYNNMNFSNDISSEFEQIIELANAELHKTFFGDAGTTLIACLIFEEKLYWVSIGDSYLFLVRNSEITRLNQSHTTRQYTTRENVSASDLTLAFDEGDSEGDRLVQFLGKECIEEIDISYRPLNLRREDKILICSDGIGDVLENSVICELLANNSVDIACKQIEDKITHMKLHNQDNFTAIAIGCK